MRLDELKNNILAIVGDKVLDAFDDQTILDAITWANNQAAILSNCCEVEAPIEHSSGYLDIPESALTVLWCSYDS